MSFCLLLILCLKGDITDLAVSSNNAVVASASNDFVIRVVRIPYVTVSCVPFLFFLSMKATSSFRLMTVAFA